MSLCLATPALALSLAVQSFNLNWTHSVEKTGWQEQWRVSQDALVLDEARIHGSGAGMEPPDDAVLKDGWWVYRSHLPPLPSLHLAVSGATGRAWQLCTHGRCDDLEVLLGVSGQPPPEIVISAQGACRPLQRRAYNLIAN